MTPGEDIEGQEQYFVLKRRSTNNIPNNKGNCNRAKLAMSNAVSNALSTAAAKISAQIGLPNTSVPPPTLTHHAGTGLTSPYYQAQEQGSLQQGHAPPQSSQHQQPSPQTLNNNGSPRVFNFDAGQTPPITSTPAPPAPATESSMAPIAPTTPLPSTQPENHANSSNNKPNGATIPPPMTNEKIGELLYKIDGKFDGLKEEFRESINRVETKTDNNKERLDSLEKETLLRSFVQKKQVKRLRRNQIISDLKQSKWEKIQLQLLTIQDNRINELEREKRSMNVKIVDVTVPAEILLSRDRNRKNEYVYDKYIKYAFPAQNLADGNIQYKHHSSILAQVFFIRSNSNNINNTAPPNPNLVNNTANPNPNLVNNTAPVNPNLDTTTSSIILCKFTSKEATAIFWSQKLNLSEILRRTAGPNARLSGDWCVGDHLCRRTWTGKVTTRGTVKKIHLSNGQLLVTFEGGPRPFQIKNVKGSTVEELLSYPVKPTILSQDDIQLTEEEIDEKMRVEDNQDIDEYNEAQHSLQS